MGIYTRTGDQGQTSLFDGTRVPKDHHRVSAYGQVDELNSVLGWACAADAPGELVARLTQVQADLFVLGAELATRPDSKRGSSLTPLDVAAVQRLEGWIDEAVAVLPPLKHFVLPGGTELAARLHIARCVCRRAEREVVALQHDEPVPADAIVYLNRLSDLLFTWARLANHQAGVPDVPWIPHE